MISIKDTFMNAVIAFGGRGVPLKERTESELIDLGIIGHSSKDPTILNLFESLPCLAELKRRKLEIIINAGK